METIKIIDLLSKIANGESVPKKIKYKGVVREFNYVDKDYTCINDKDYYLFHDTLAEGTGDKMVTALNDAVKIIEDAPKEDKKIEKLKIYDNPVEWCCNGRAINDTEKNIIDKINEIIDKVNGE